ncbi:hypothetical protein Mgra_00002780 [Meloidogyne graminicola]|uniref:NADH:ubiquinone reductase (H(+)-translocating) n=1 Tax=Meloidogyne graminicola TaxID=189291 RepID=A0A8S9ZW17_9BILA|nr:hypothetical protein Mgra_00002780 [Meloidogyne graminicola]
MGIYLWFFLFYINCQLLKGADGQIFFIFKEKKWLGGGVNILLLLLLYYYITFFLEIIYIFSIGQIFVKGKKSLYYEIFINLKIINLKTKYF